MTQKNKIIYYISFLFFLIGCVASRASIVNNLSPNSSVDSNHVALSVLLVLITLGLGIYSYFGLVRKVSPRKLPKLIHQFGVASIVISVVLILIVLVLFVWLLVSTPQWGYGLIESSKYVH